MEMFTIVRPEHLNHYGSLFGGQLLKWIDEFAFLAAIREFPGCRLVTRAMDNVSFARGVRNGSLLRFAIERMDIGNSSATYKVDVFARETGSAEDTHVFETAITFVSVNAKQQKVPLPAPLEAS